MIDARESRKLGLVTIEFRTLADLILGRRSLIPTNKRLAFSDAIEVDHVLVKPKREIVELVLSTEASDTSPLYRVGRTQEPPELDIGLQDIETMDDTTLGWCLQNPQIRSRLVCLSKRILNHLI